MRQRHYEGVAFPVRQQTVNVIVVDGKKHSGAPLFHKSANADAKK
jgi:hypothetical protein